MTKQVESTPTKASLVSHVGTIVVKGGGNQRSRCHQAKETTWPVSDQVAVAPH